MKAYGVERRKRCCPGHDPDSKKFDRVNWKRRRNTTSRRNSNRSTKKSARQEGKKDTDEH